MSMGQFQQSSGQAWVFFNLLSPLSRFNLKRMLRTGNSWYSDSVLPQVAQQRMMAGSYAARAVPPIPVGCPLIGTHGKDE
ncbi:uncharacterized protein METZ01_LOCUS109681 [marine metagenome]|uniref:Uncharacterized protein n=1 Tax=marine metagenome TaxID=408172 RepID=A0A381WY26_9ZZZZ